MKDIKKYGEKQFALSQISCPIEKHKKRENFRDNCVNYKKLLCFTLLPLQDIVQKS